MTKILKGKTIDWNKQANSSFEDIKQRLTSAPVLELPNFFKIFEVVCDASGVGIRVVLSKRSGN